MFLAGIAPRLRVLRVHQRMPFRSLPRLSRGLRRLAARQPCLLVSRHQQAFISERF